MRHKLILILCFTFYFIHIYSQGYKLESIVKGKTNINLDSFNVALIDSVLNKDFPIEFYEIKPMDLHGKFKFWIYINNWDFKVLCFAYILYG